jgi:hypothetical protein
LSLVRILVTSTAGDGHLSPLIPFVAALRSRGDEVLVVVPPSAAERARRTGAGVCLVEAPPADALADAWARFVVAPAAEAAVIANREIFGRLCTAAMLPTVDEVCRTWRTASTKPLNSPDRSSRTGTVSHIYRSRSHWRMWRRPPWS